MLQVDIQQSVSIGVYLSFDVVQNGIVWTPHMGNGGNKTLDKAAYSLTQAATRNREHDNQHGNALRWAGEDCTSRSDCRSTR